MKCLFLTVLLFASGASLLLSQEGEAMGAALETASSGDLFSKANASYETGDYEQALIYYREILDSGFEAADIYYNMGNAAYRSNSIGHAILYYEKALKLDPSHENAEHNLLFMSRYRVDAFEEVPEFFIRSWITSIIKALKEKTWSILAIISLLFMLTAFLFYLFSRNLGLKKSGFFAALAGLIIFVLTLSSSVAQHRDVKHPDRAIILSPSVVVRSTPSESGTELFILHEGSGVRVLEEVTGWYNILIIDGREGWIREGDFGRI